jgi:hypothetical protein
MGKLSGASQGWQNNEGGHPMATISQYTVTCPAPCGHTMTASSEDEIVRLVQDHVKTVHKGPPPDRGDVLKLAKTV